MILDKMKNFGYIVDNNYVFSDNDSMKYNIRILIPYGFDRQDLLVFPYTSIFLGILDNFFTFPCKIDYKMGPTYSILKFTTYELSNIPIILGTVFNFMETMDVEKIIAPLEPEKDNKSLLEKFIESQRSLYAQGSYDFLSYNGTTISDLMYKEYQFLSTGKKEDILKKLSNTKEIFKEEKVIIFLQGMNVSTLDFKSNKLEIDRIQKCSLYERNKYSIADNAKTITLFFENNSEDRINYILNLFILDFYSVLFETHRYVVNIPNSLIFYFDTDTDMYGKDVMTRQWGKRVFNEEDENLAISYNEYKSDFLEKVLDNFDNYENNIDKAIEVFTGNEIFFTRAELLEVINQVTLRDFKTFINDLFFIIDLIEKARNGE